MLKILLLAALALPACVADNGPDPAPSDDAKTLSQIKADTTGTIARDTECHILPDSPACIAACDPDPAAMDAFIPEGTCALIRCTLDDGSPVAAGGCR